MSRTARVVACSPEDVFAVLADGWLYPVWVVGASRVRHVDAEWPRPGTALHHSIGIWPVLFDDTTEVVEWSPDDTISLRARVGPLGRAVIVLTVRPHSRGCTVTMGERFVGGVAATLPYLLRRLALTLRNHENLNRLAHLPEGRRADRETDDDVDRGHVPRHPHGQASPGSRDDADDVPARADDF